MRIGKLKIMERRVIGNTDFGTPLLIRWIILRHPSLFGVFLHKLCRSDYDRALHDHPWSFVSVVLKNGYFERAFCPKDQKLPNENIIGRFGDEALIWNRQGAILYRPAEWRHRVIIENERKPAWTLVFMGPRARRWGFWLDSGWCWWRKHNPYKNICEEDVYWPDRGEGE